MNNDILNSLQERVKEAEGMLLGNGSWKSKFNEHISDILKIYPNPLEKVKTPYRIRPATGLFVYSSINSVKISNNSSRYYDLRYVGQSVADVKIDVKSQKAFVRTKKNGDKDYDKSNKKYFNITTTIPNWSEWNDNLVKKFRTEFNNRKEIESGKSPEHAMESKMLVDFSKKKRSQGKLLCNIQPVRLGGCFFQMKTPFSASKDSLKFNESSGGGIDILARIVTKQNEVRLVILELKDENKSSEPPEKVVRQAVAYATFIGHLLADEEQGAKWWKLFGFKREKPEKIKLIASTFMPLSENNSLNSFGCEGEVLKLKGVENVEIELHSLFLDLKTNTFSGSLKDIMME